MFVDSAHKEIQDGKAKDFTLYESQQVTVVVGHADWKLLGVPWECRLGGGPAKEVEEVAGLLFPVLYYAEMIKL